MEMHCFTQNGGTVEFNQIGFIFVNNIHWPDSLAAPVQAPLNIMSVKGGLTVKTLKDIDPGAAAAVKEITVGGGHAQAAARYRAYAGNKGGMYRKKAPAEILKRF